MINFSIPFWLFGTIVGAICFGLLATALSIGYKVRKLKSQKGRETQISSMATTMLTNHFQHNLLGMQVDAVFDSLTALIETERIKLKALVAPSLNSVTAFAPQECPTPVQEQVQDESTSQTLEEFEADSDHGSAAEGHRAGSGLSKAERDLVEKMRSFQVEKHRKLEAVA